MAEKKPPGLNILYKSLSFLPKMPDEDAGRLFKALYNFGDSGDIPDFADEYTPLGLTFQTLSQQIEENNNKYAEKCRQNAENAKGRKKPTDPF